MDGDLPRHNTSSVTITKVQDKNKLVTHHLTKFQECRERTEIGQAFSHLSMVLTLQPSLQKVYLTTYLQLLELWTSSLEETHDISKLITLFEVAFNIYPNSSDLHHLLSKILYKEGNIREAWKYAQQAHNGSKKDPHCKENFARLSNALVDRWHIPMLNDNTRNKVFKEAIDRAIQDGYNKVLDIGAGTGLLSIYAANSGAKSAIACEMDDHMCDMAKEIVKENKPKERITVIDKHSTDLVVGEDLPEKVSLVVSEIVDAGLFGESILQTLSHAWKTLLHPPQQKFLQPSENKDDKSFVFHDSISHSGKVIPQRAEIFVALVECDYIARQTKFKPHKGDILERFSIYLKFEEPYTCEKLGRVSGGYKLLTEWKCFDDIDFNDLNDVENHLDNKIDKNIKLDCKVQGRVDAIVMAFKLHIDESHVIETFPESSTCWENSVYPVFAFRSVAVDESINIKYNCNSLINLQIEEQLEFNDKRIPTIHLNSYSVKCLNSKSFTKFFNEAASMIAIHFQKVQNKKPLTILDTTPFPIGGLALLKLYPSSELYIDVDDIEIQKALTQVGVDFKTSAMLRSNVDVMFIWPVMEDGTLTDCLPEKCEEIGSRMSADGILFPSNLKLEITAVDCEELTQMTKVNDSNTFGVRVADIVNVARTTHQLDLPLSGLNMRCFKVPDPLVNFNLITGIASTTVQPACHKRDENSMDGFMVLGGPVLEVSLPLLPLTNMNINALAYNFNLSGGKFGNKLSEQNTVCSNESNDSVPSTSAFEETSNMINKSEVSENTSTASPLDLSTLMMSTYDCDSPCNQSVFMLDSPVTVVSIDNITDTVSSKEENSENIHLSVVWRDCFFAASLHHVGK